MRGITLLEEALDNYEKMEGMFDEDSGVSVVLVESKLRREQEERELYG